MCAILTLFIIIQIQLRFNIWRLLFGGKANETDEDGTKASIKLIYAKRCLTRSPDSA